MANRLAREASPYLKQHADNPVDWYPWGREALDRAERDDKPILLSIGYSACHWCHVMEHECFEDQEIAKLMNEHFVCIKVDREERPDLDQIYQLVVQLLGRSGGWPLTVFLTPTQKPFFGGTYFPPVDRHGMPAFPRILQAVADAYREKRSDIEQQSTEIASAIGHVTHVEPKAASSTPDVLGRAAARLGARFDDEHGGFGSRPKFPSTMSLDVLLHHAVSNQDDRALGRVRKALDAMRSGGIYDHLGGGFHRYSTDERWLVPHFEKMLYDNALLLRSYVDGYRVFGDDRYANTARGIVRWLEREMLSPEGGFYATQDADSEGEEGRFFVWTVAEVREAAGDDANLACMRYGVVDEGNFPDLAGANVLSIRTSIEQLALRFALAPTEVEKRLGVVDAALLAHREKRIKPFRDDKLLASWNALLIGALADASRALREPRWLELARRAFDFVWESLATSGRVRRHPSGGQGFLDDHAFLGCAALDLYEATGDGRYMACAKTLAETIRHHFQSPDGDGTFYLTADDGEKLITRPVDLFDHSVPSATSMAVLLFLRLGALAVPELHTIAERQVQTLSAAAEENPFGLAQMVLAVDRVARSTTDIVLVGESQELLGAAFGVFVPHRNIAWVGVDGGSDAPVLAEGKPAHQTAAYVCRNRSCSPPALRYRELLDVLSRSSDIGTTP